MRLSSLNKFIMKFFNIQIITSTQEQQVLQNLDISMSDININKLVNGWTILDKIPKSVVLIGYSHTGRTTLAELIKKYYFKNPSNGLTYEGGKYNLQNVISVKSLKIQTTIPVVYQANNDNKEDVKILDVPSFCLAPDTKKWTAFQQKITASYMFQKIQRVGFLIFVEQKSTRTNIAPWKKVLMSFMDLFNGEFNDDLLDSIGIIVTKSPSDIKQDTMPKRLQMMQQSLVKQKGVNIEAVQKLFKNIINKNRVFIVKKSTGQGSEEQEIIDLAKRLQNLPNCEIDKNRLKQLSWSLDEEKIIGDYISQSSQLLQSLVQTIKEVFSQVNFTANSIKQLKKKRKIDKSNTEIIPNLAIQALLDANNIKKINLFKIVENYYNLKTSMEELNAQSFVNKIEQILTFLIKFQIFFTQHQDLPFFQNIFEVFSFIKVTNYKPPSFARHLEAIKLLFSQDINQSVLKLLVEAQSSNQIKQFYEKSMQFINRKQPISSSLQPFYQKCQLKLIKYSNPKQALTRLVQMLKEQKDKRMVTLILNQITDAFKKANLVKEALLLFKLAKSPSDVIECYKEIINNDEMAAKEYILYLTEMYLFEQAKYACYNMAAKFGAGSRERFGELLNNVISQQKRYLSEAIRSNILLEDIEINGNALSQIEKAVNEAITRM